MKFLPSSLQLLVSSFPNHHLYCTIPAKRGALDLYSNKVLIDQLTHSRLSDCPPPTTGKKCKNRMNQVCSQMLIYHVGQMLSTEGQHSFWCSLQKQNTTACNRVASKDRSFEHCRFLLLLKLLLQ